MPPAFQHILSTLPGVRRNGKGWVCLCPAHDDRKPSLVVSVSEDEQTLLFWCRNGCLFGDIMEGLGLHPRQLFSDDGIPFTPEDRREEKLTKYIYRDEEGRELFQVHRVEWVDRKGVRHKTFRQGHTGSDGVWAWNLVNVRRVPYRLPEIIAAANKPLVIVEGEKCVDRLWRAGIPATCNPAGAGQWKIDFGPVLTGRRVAIIPDNDDSGRQHAANVAGCALLYGADSIRIVELPGLRPKEDVWDFLQSSPVERLVEIIRNTPEYRSQTQ